MQQEGKALHNKQYEQIKSSKLSNRQGNRRRLYERRRLCSYDGLAQQNETTLICSMKFCNAWQTLNCLSVTTAGITEPNLTS